MKGTSKLVMGATLVMLVSLTVVLALVLVLLAELYCSLLLRRRRLENTTTSMASVPAATSVTSSDTRRPTRNLSGPLSSLYAQGVIEAPRRFLFPAIITKEEQKFSTNKQQEQCKFEEDPKGKQHCIVGMPSPPSFVSRLPPHLVQEVTLEGGSSSSSDGGEHLVYISNPIYDGETPRHSRACTPFETPDTSPSRLEYSGSSGDDDETIEAEPSPSPSRSKPSSQPITPPLSPMKKIPTEACSVSLRDARALLTSGSGSETSKGSSSSTDSPHTSPSCAPRDLFIAFKQYKETDTRERFVHLDEDIVYWGLMKAQSSNFSLQYCRREWRLKSEMVQVEEARLE